MPLNGPFDTFGCFTDHPDYDAYTLTWSRFGLPVEQASASQTGCAFCRDDGVFFHRPAGAQALYADIAAAIAFHTTASGQTG
jgi:hypothetical protein